MNYAAYIEQYVLTDGFDYTAEVERIEVKTDYINIEDYARWKGNLKHLKTLVDQVYPPITIVQMAPEKTYESILYADEFNLIEENLARSVAVTLPLPL